MANYSVPADFNSNSIHIFSKLMKKYPGEVISEVYGSLPIYGSGRGKYIKSNCNISLEMLKDYISNLKAKNIMFNYCLNFVDFQSENERTDQLSNILYFMGTLIEIGVEKFTLTIPELIFLARKTYPNISISASAITNIDSVKRAQGVQALGANSIVLGEDCTRNLKLISDIKKSTKLDISIITNSMCVFNCLYRQSHYIAISHERELSQRSISTLYTKWCAEQFAQDLVEYIKSPWIRPEDTELYQRLGIDIFKIIGRERIHEMKIEPLLDAYMQHNFEGNLLDLIYGFSIKNSVCVDNKKLDGFINHFMRPYACFSCGSNTCTHCHKYFENAVVRNE